MERIIPRLTDEDLLLIARETKERQDELKEWEAIRLGEGRRARWLKGRLAFLREQRATELRLRKKDRPDMRKARGEAKAKRLRKIQAVIDRATTVE